MKRGGCPTWTCLVEQALRAQDDFMDYQMLMKSTGGTIGQVSAACYNLLRYRVVGVEILADGKGWWYALPKTGDTRSRHLDERIPESKPRKPRKPRKSAV